jgi:hypothetical protein
MGLVVSGCSKPGERISKLFMTMLGLSQPLNIALIVIQIEMETMSQETLDGLQLKNKIATGDDQKEDGKTNLRKNNSASAVQKEEKMTKSPAQLSCRNCDPS